MDNKQITKTLKLTIQLMELHEENVFKIRSYQSAVNTIERESPQLSELGFSALQEINGIGKSIATVIQELLSTGSHSLLEELLENTPEGILEVLQIKGLGPKKIKILWKELGITSTHELMEACQAGKVAELKGFGEKTQESIITALEFMDANLGKYLYAEVDEPTNQLLTQLKENFGDAKVSVVGDFGRTLEIIEFLEIVVATDNAEQGHKKIDGLSILEKELKNSSPFRWGGFLNGAIPVVIWLVGEEGFHQQCLLRTASKGHLLTLVDETRTWLDVVRSEKFASEEEAYATVGSRFIPAELREGHFEWEMAKEGNLPKLLEVEDLKGPLHNHSTYSDGRHTLREMAEYCREQGFSYLGMADHSQSAFYANGLNEERVKKQLKEIEELNSEMAPFKIFRGIESDILMDGSLDYPNQVLQTFDYVVASVHSGLGMDVKKATARLLKAIQNPYTTILGHPTGRLLLRREGYPIDHKAIIDACAKYEVVIEINANPWRLDLDWRWVHYAMDKGVMLSINPDAHETGGFADMKYGVLVGRKGGLTKEMTLNTKTLEELTAYFEKMKKKNV
ncbi:DNA polymerase/3'-5' exonuclease PolX [Pleomorphovibrio marinus]|uniref:DNA polymerase/3'-5' exonuclease PolX n=1 Tax=Pleomorphovibrio marinus TaxID=2164132 RepID=UPI000E0ACBF1|nr:DNA polymerase/3'-5' exonuclease PolX [Pleomorphovibrio marinus]